MTFGEKLQKLRAREGLSQDRLAELLNVTRQAVSKWERDETMPEAEKIIRISDHFGVTTDYLLKDGPEKFPANPRRLPDFEAWYREKGYQLGWLLVALGLWWFLRMSPMLFFGDCWWDTAWMFLHTAYLGAWVAVVGGLSVGLGRRCRGNLRWYHTGWLPVFWAGLEGLRILALEIVTRHPPKNVSIVSDESFWEQYGKYIVVMAIAALAGLAVFFLGKRRDSKKEAGAKTSMPS